MALENSGRDAAERFPFDQIYKAMCGHPATIRDMLENHLAQPRGPLPAAVVDALDLDTARLLPNEWVTRDFRTRRGDLVACVEFKQEARRAGFPERLFLHTEHQSRGDRDMMHRFLEYGGELSRELRGSGALGAGGDCPIVCVLVYNGRPPWSAPTRASEIGPAPAAFGREPALPDGLAVLYPRGYHPIELARLGADATKPDGVVSLMAGIEHAGRRGLAEAFSAGPLPRIWRGLDGSLQRTVAAWIWRLAQRCGIEAEMEDLMRLEEIGEVASLLEETLDMELAEAREEALAEGREKGIAEGRESGIAEGRETGIAEGQRGLLRNLAALRFGEPTAARLAAVIGRIDSLAALRRAGEWVVRCDSAEDLLRRVADVARGSGNGATPG